MRPDQAKVYAWRRRAARNLPALAVRVFALRGKLYPGCGFHYALESQLGWVLHDLNSFDKRMTDADNMVSEIALEELYRNTRRAELGAR